MNDSYSETLIRSILNSSYKRIVFYFSGLNDVIDNATENSFAPPVPVPAAILIFAPALLGAIRNTP